MKQTRFPLYEVHKPIYGQRGEVLLPLAVVERNGQTGTTDTARTLKNIYTGEEATFPEAAFFYHWHVVGDEFLVFLSIHRAWVIKNKVFFGL